jgi:hypoxanthine phosphoribosyltransferase
VSGGAGDGGARTHAAWFEAEILIPAGEIASRVGDLGEQIAADLQEELEREGAGMDAPERIVLLPVLDGAVIFLADLIRRMPMTMRMEMVSVSSYRGATTESRGARLRSALPDDLGGKHVVIVDDIYDTGQTLALLQRLIGEEARVDYVGFEIPDEFVVGYGLDYDGLYRNLPEIRILPEGAR